MSEISKEQLAALKAEQNARAPYDLAEAPSKLAEHTAAVAAAGVPDAPAE